MNASNMLLKIATESQVRLNTQRKLWKSVEERQSRYWSLSKMERYNLIKDELNLKIFPAHEDTLKLFRQIDHNKMTWNQIKSIVGGN